MLYKHLDCCPVFFTCLEYCIDFTMLNTGLFSVLLCESQVVDYCMCLPKIVFYHSLLIMTLLCTDNEV